MTPHQILAVTVRLFAIWLALIVGRELIGAYVAGRARDDAYIFSLAVTVAAVSVVIVVVLWFFPRTIARGLLPSSIDRQAPVEPRFPPEVWFAVGSSLIGLWLLASAVPGLLRNLFVMFIFRSDNVDTSGLITGLVYLSIQIVVGVALIVWSEGIRRLVWWLRHAGPD
jgi:hypothetical protein